MNDVLEPALAQILGDPITIGLLALLVIALIVASVAGRRAQAAERVRKRLEYVADTSARDDDAIAQRLALDFGDDAENPPVLARFLGLISPLAAQLPLVGEKDRIKLLKLMNVAGFRSPEAINLMLSAKLACGVLVGTVVYGAVVSGDQPMATGMRAFISLPVGIVLGAMAPEFYVKWLAKRRRKRISKAVPDALDLMVICAEAGLTLETALHRVSRELKTANPELALELATTEAELKVLPERRMAFENLVDRTDVPEMASLTITMNQAEKYGTSLSQALRTIAAEGRRTRMLRIEEKAARLPALMSLPLMVFVLPPCAVIVVGPAMVNLMDSLAGG